MWKLGHMGNQLVKDHSVPMTTVGIAGGQHVGQQKPKETPSRG